jgi:hypothetical protein
MPQGNTPQAVEKYKLSKEQMEFAKNMRKISKIQKVLAQGIQYKATQLQTMQQMATGIDLQVKQMLSSAPNELDELVGQPDAINLAINY